MRMGFAVLAAAVALVAVPLAVADANFTDPTGDANGAPDVVAVIVANDAKNRVTFEIELAGDQRLPDDGEIALMIDTDKNPETGRGGWDYFVIVASDESSMLRSWDGTQWVDAPSTTARAWVIGGYVQYSIDRSELGNSAAFDFTVDSAKVTNDEVVASDLAPEENSYWSYTTVAKTYGIVGTPLVVKPTRPAASTKVLASFITVRTDSLEPLWESKSTCRATVGGKRVTTRLRSELGFAHCETVRLPKNGKGKLLKVTLTTSAGGKTVTKTFSAKLR
jgi:hypothetical protein